MVLIQNVGNYSPLKSFFWSVHIHVRLMLTKPAVNADIFYISAYLVKFLDLNFD